MSSSIETEKREKSLLLLGCSYDYQEKPTNSWLLLPPTGLLDERPSKPGPTQLWKHGYGFTGSVIVGSYLYLIGGTSMRCLGPLHYRIRSTKIRRINISEPNQCWEICHVLPFYCFTSAVTVFGDLIYVFQSREFSSRKDRSCRLKELRWGMEYTVPGDWAYIYDTREKKGRFIDQPEGEYIYSQVLFCASIEWNGQPKVLVCTKSFKIYLHDPIQNKWEQYIDYVKSPIDVFHPSKEFIFAKVVSNNILYYLQYKGASDRTPEVNPTLSAYNLREGRLMFELQLSVGSGVGMDSISYLVVVNDTTICWIETNSCHCRGFYFTKIFVRYDPSPCLVILKRRRFIADIGSIACCIPIDFPYEDCGSLVVTNRKEVSNGIVLKKGYRNKDLDLGLKLLSS